MLSSCSALLGTAPTGEKGLSVEATAVLLQGIAADIRSWDVDGDGYITDKELPLLGAQVSTRVLAAMRPLPENR